VLLTSVVKAAGFWPPDQVAPSGPGMSLAASLAGSREAALGIKPGAYGPRFRWSAAEPASREAAPEDARASPRHRLPPLMPCQAKRLLPRIASSGPLCAANDTADESMPGGTQGLAGSPLFVLTINRRRRLRGCRYPGRCAMPTRGQRPQAIGPGPLARAGAAEASRDQKPALPAGTTETSRMRLPASTKPSGLLAKSPGRRCWKTALGSRFRVCEPVSRSMAS